MPRVFEDLECDVPEKSAAAARKNMADARSKLFSDEYTSQDCPPVSISKSNLQKKNIRIRNQINDRLIFINFYFHKFFF